MNDEQWTNDTPEWIKVLAASERRKAQFIELAPDIDAVLARLDASTDWTRIWSKQK